MGRTYYAHMRSGYVYLPSKPQRDSDFFGDYARREHENGPAPVLGAGPFDRLRDGPGQLRVSAISLTGPSAR
ncbi:hypothetical protein GCM10027590_02430 [Nocardiopsis nanhaiensis]